MMFQDTPAIRAFVKYLATPEAGTIWAKPAAFRHRTRRRGERLSGPITRTTATELGKAQTFRFDMSDLQPAAFGGTVGQGEFKIFQDFLKNPNNVDGTAAAARGGGREGLQAGSSGAEARRHRRGAALAAPPPARRDGSFGARHAVALRSSRPRSILLAVWIVYPTIYTISRSFFDATGRTSSGSTTTRRSSRPTSSRRRSRTT